MTTNKDSIATGENTESKTAATAPETKATAKNGRLKRNGIELVTITFLLVIGILLMPNRVTQNDAKANPIAWLASITYFVVLTAVRWGINETLSETKRKLLEHHGGITLDDDAEGTAEVNTAWWTGNSTTQIRKRNTWDSANQRWTGRWTKKTKIATQGHQWDTSPVGTHEDGTAMRTAEAERFLTPARYTYKNTLLEMFGRDPDGTVYYKQDVAVDGREDSYNRNKARQLRIWRGIYGNHIFFGPEFYIRTFTPNVDDYEMKSIWDSDGWSALGHADAEDPEANTYEGKLYWKYRYYLTSARLGIERPRQEFFDFKSYTNSKTNYMVCKKNQVITQGPDISNSISRKFKTESTYTNMWVQFHDGTGYGHGGPGTQSYWKWVQIHNGYKRLVVHFEKGAR